MGGNGKKSVTERTIRFLSSYGFAAMLLLVLLVLTYLGTLEQIDTGIYHVQKKYFESLVLVHWIDGKVPIPLPGAYLVFVLLSANLLLGGLIRMRRSWTRIGIYITHIGIVVLLLSSFVSFRTKVEGFVRLDPNAEVNEFESFYQWELVIFRTAEDGRVTEHLVHESRFRDLDPEDPPVFRSDEVPFEITVREFLPNSFPEIARTAAEAEQGVKGFYLQERELARSAEHDVPGMRVSIDFPDTGRTEETLLWGRQIFPHLVEVDGEEWAVHLRKVTRSLPFTLRLDDFTMKRHPGIRTPKVFRSEVTKDPGGADRKVKITMNEPFREGGFTLYQTTWGPQDPDYEGPLWSGLSVVKNPADQWPLVSCVIIGIGLAVHFIRKMVLYLDRESRRRA